MGLGAASAMAGKMVVLGIGGALAVSAKAAIDFESSMAGVAKTTDMAGNSFEKNSGPLFNFGEALREMSMRVPMNVNELAQIAEIGGQLGVETPNLLRFTEVMAAMGVTTNMSSLEAAKGFARFANIMRTPQQEFDRLGSIVVELGNNFATTETEILTFATRLAPVGTVVGMTEEQVFALSAALTSLGVPAERGGTALQRVFISMKSAIDSGGESLQQFADVANMSTDAFADLFTESPAQAFSAFVKGLDDISKSGDNVFQTLDQMGLAEQRTIQVLLATASGFEVVDDAINAANVAGEENLALFEEAAKRYGTTASQIQILGNSFNDLRIEIGNMLLSGGGLQFAMETLAQFFSILKENLPLLGRFATVAATVAALNFGARLFQGGMAAWGRFSAMLASANTQLKVLPGLARAGAAGMFILQTAMMSIMAIGTALIGIWAIQAINAAQLRMEVQQLNDALEEGVDPLTALVSHFQQLGILTPEAISGLTTLGLSTEDFAKHLLEGGDALSFIGGEGKAFQEVVGDIIRAQGRAGEPGVWEEIEIAVSNVQKAAIAANEQVQGFLELKANNLVDALRTAGVGAEMTSEQLKAAALAAVQLFGFDISDSTFVSWMAGGRRSEPRRGLGAIPIEAGAAIESIRALDRTWQRYMLNLEGGQDIIEDFWDFMQEGVEGFNDTIQEEMDRVDESIRGGFPVWGEYEQIVIGATDELGNSVTASISEVLAAQDAFVADMTAFVNRMPQIMAMAGPQTVAMIEAMEPAMRGAIGRMTDAELEEFITGSDENFDAINKLYMERFLQVFPDAARAGFDVLIGDMGTWVEEFGPPGELGGQMFIDGLMAQMAMMPAAHQAEFVKYIAELVDNPEMFGEMGFESFEAWITGLLESMMGASERVIAVWEGESTAMKNAINGSWEVRSPSQWWHRLGVSWMEGLNEGIEAGKGQFNFAAKFAPENFMPSMSSVPGSSSTVSTAKTINLNFSGAAKGTVAETQTALTLLNLVGSVESGAGRMN